MFALLEHDTTIPKAPRPAADGRHWDFMVGLPDQVRLPTWRLTHNPVATEGDISAERITDHRRLYLDYEGEISGGRGFVRRIDHGPATVERLEGDELVIVLAGRHLRGRYGIAHTAGGVLVFRRSASAV